MKKLLLFLVAVVALFAGSGDPPAGEDSVQNWVEYLSLLNLFILVLLPKLHQVIKTVMEFKETLVLLEGDVEILTEAVVEYLPEDKGNEVMRKLLLNRNKKERK